MYPVTGKYAWVGLDECEVTYLNDFRWSPELIKWSDFLLLLEGQTVHLPRPTNIFATDLCIQRDNTLPIFATSKGPIEYVGQYNSRVEHETDMRGQPEPTVRCALIGQFEFNLICMTIIQQFFLAN